MEDNADADALVHTPALDGLGLGGGSVICDSCNRRITPDAATSDAADPTADTDAEWRVFVYVSRSGGNWYARFATCSTCGPISDTDTTGCDDGEAVVRARLAFDEFRARWVVADAHLAPSVEHRGNVTGLQSDDGAWLR